MALELDVDSGRVTVLVHRQGCEHGVGRVLVVEPYVTVADGWTVRGCTACQPQYGVLVRSRRAMRFWDLHRIPERFLEGERRTPGDLKALDVPVHYRRVRGWKRYANCRTTGRLGEWLRWLYVGDHQRKWAVTVQKELCGECPVRRECLEAGVWGRDGNGEPWGIWGGATVAERSKLRKRWVREGRTDVVGLGSENGSRDTAAGRAG